jgi:hypothetical protein
VPEASPGVEDPRTRARLASFEGPSPLLLSAQLALLTAGTTAVEPTETASVNASSLVLLSLTECGLCQLLMHRCCCARTGGICGVCSPADPRSGATCSSVVVRGALKGQCNTSAPSGGSDTAVRKADTFAGTDMDAARGIWIGTDHSEAGGGASLTLDALMARATQHNMARATQHNIASERRGRGGACDSNAGDARDILDGALALSSSSTRAGGFTSTDTPSSSAGNAASSGDFLNLGSRWAPAACAPATPLPTRHAVDVLKVSAAEAIRPVATPQLRPHVPPRSPHINETLGCACAETG